MRRQQAEYAIDLVNVSKKFKRRTLSRNSYTTIKSNIVTFFKAKQDRTQHITRAIQDLTVRIPQGSSVGIIGKNGSGKSTLLKLITGIYKPDQGQICVNGRVAALIELGAGFHPDFSGRENLFLGGTLHGLSRAEISRKLDKIVEFAELQDVIDDPVRTYSSGMFMRLGFSLAVHTDPDVLLIDEVLAVGDATFVNKCKERIAELRKAGKTLLLVTHDLDAVARWCDEAIWLEAGKVRDRGYPRRVIDNYLSFVEKNEEELLLLDAQEQQAILDQNSHQPSSENMETTCDDNDSARWGSREIEIISVRTLDQTNENRLSFRPNDGLTIEIEYIVHQPEVVQNVVLGIGINRSDGLVVHGSNTEIEDISVPKLGKRGTIEYKIKRLGLLDGVYSLDVAAHCVDGYAYDYHKGIVSIAIRSSQKQIGVMLPEHSWSFHPTQEKGKC